MACPLYSGLRLGFAWNATPSICNRKPLGAEALPQECRSSGQPTDEVPLLLLLDVSGMETGPLQVWAIHSENHQPMTLAKFRNMEPCTVGLMALLWALCSSVASNYIRFNPSLGPQEMICSDQGPIARLLIPRKLPWRDGVTRPERAFVRSSESLALRRLRGQQASLLKGTSDSDTVLLHY